MINLTLSDQFVLPKKYLIILFIVVFVLLSIINLPAAMMGGLLKKSGLNYRLIEGSLWHAVVYDANFRGYPVRKLVLEPKLANLAIFQLAADFNAVNDQGKFSGKIKKKEQGGLLFSKIDALANVVISKNAYTFPAEFNLTSDQLEFDKLGQCRAGNFMIKSNLTDLLFASVATELPPLNGQGHCDDGTINMTLQTSGNGFDISFIGEMDNHISSTMINIKLPENLSNLPRVTNELTARGFALSNGVWQTVMEIKV